MAHGDRQWKSGGSRGEPEQGPARGQGQSQGWLRGLSLRNRPVRAVRRALLRAVGGHGGLETPILSTSAVLQLHMAVWDTAGPNPAVTQQFRASLHSPNVAALQLVRAGGLPQCDAICTW